MGLLTFRGETRELALHLSALALGRHNVKTAAHEPGRWPSPDSVSAGTLILDFQASRNGRIECLLSKPPTPSRLFCYNHPD